MPITVEQLCARLGLDCLGDASMELDAVANISSAVDRQLSFLSSESKLDSSNENLDCAVITSEAIAENLNAKAIIVSANPQLSFAKAVPLVLSDTSKDSSVHDRAVIADSVKLGSGVSISAGVVIEHNAEIGSGVSIGANAYIGSSSRVGQNTVIDPSACLLANTLVGENCHISSGSVIGSPGFGIVPDGKKWVRFPQLGKVIIGDAVDVGANCCIDRGALEDTIIESGVKLDNLIQVAHNVRIGENTVIAACTGIAGSAKIGKNCQIGGRASIQGHITIADNVVITTCTFVNKSIFKAGVYSSSLSAQENSTWLKNHARLHRLDKISRQVRQHEAELNHLIVKGERSEK